MAVFTSERCILPPSPVAVCDIGSASFKYDMRRLSEILAFPRAWYRRSIARRLFLGDQTINLPGERPTRRRTPSVISLAGFSPSAATDVTLDLLTPTTQLLEASEKLLSLHLLLLLYLFYPLLLYLQNTL